jgi:Peptidase U49
MGAIRQINGAPLFDVLRRAAPHKGQELDKLIAERNPRFLLDAEEEKILFRTNGSMNTITIGVKCTCRLQAHSVAGGIFISALSTSGYLKLSPQERAKLYAPAEPLLTWAVGRDLRGWLKRRDGIERSLEEIMEGSEMELPPDLLASLTPEQWVLGQGLFTFATAFILLHEFGHLHLNHSGCSGTASILQEKDADRFAADWLIGSSSLSEARRLNCLLGMSIALLWLTVFNVFLGPGQSRTHPRGYDRLFQVLDLAISSDDEVESVMVWEFVSRLLFVHMDTADFQFDASRMQGTPRDQVNYLVDLLSKE